MCNEPGTCTGTFLHIEYLANQLQCEVRIEKFELYQKF